MDLSVVLVEPKYGGNIGASARAMKNFGFSKLVLINPCEFDKECYQRAMHAEDVIENAKTYSKLEEFASGIQVVVGTTGILNLNEKAYIRNPMTPKELGEKISSTEESIAVLFGREDYGLHNDELTLCDLVVSIPTAEEYPVMNLSHSVAVLLYELSLCKLKVPQARGMNKVEKEKFLEMFDKLLLSIDYPEHKYENTKILFRRLIGRSMPTAWEFHTLMGVLAKSVEYAEQCKRKDEDD
ncbi:MAG: RNA methyltransferase [Thermoplasmata archaeon]|nr:MAG: RNA methyltransferase [Thermoplasmata archaeon]